MKHLRIILGFLLLGAIVNVAVAWGIALWMPVASAGKLTDHTRLVIDRAGLDSVHLNHDSGLGIYLVTVYRGGFSPISAIVYEAGFPWRSMTGWRGSLVDQEFYLAAPTSLNVLDDDLGPRIIPPCPLWTGFSLNTIFYGAILWLLFPGRIFLRRLNRRRRSLCEKCAYNLRGMNHSLCPECGEEIRKGNPA